MQVVSVAQTFCEVWETVAALLAEVDLLAGFAELAVNAPMPYVRPEMLPPDEGRLELIGCRQAPSCHISSMASQFPGTASQLEIQIPFVWKAWS